MPSALDLLLSQLRRDMENAEAPLRSQLVLVYESAIAELEHDLFNVTWLIEDALSRGEDITPDWLYRQDRYQRLIAKSEAQLARFTDEALPLIEHTNLSGARLGARHATPLLEAAGIQASFGTSINVPAVETIVQNMFRAGPIRDVLDSYGGNATAVIRHELAQGITLGKSPREVVRRIQDTLISGTNRARLTTLTRTEMMRSYRVAQGELTIHGLGTRSGFGVQQVVERAGEDLVKGAASDALKKCATLFGVALELYGSDYEANDAPSAPQKGSQAPAKPTPVNAGDDKPITDAAMKRIHALLAEQNLGHEYLTIWAIDHGHESSKQLTMGQVTKLGNGLKEKPEAVVKYLDQIKTNQEVGKMADAQKAGQ